ncbi:MAG: tail fiber domain-containing protein [Candidatus Omnitrophota bacterium]|nr:tail fiber domain-containing protein [Candidatus Omnitrophota bacterium]
MFKLRKFLPLPISLLSLLLALTFNPLAFAEDTLTITTYYPSPYGVYREMRSQRMAIGDSYIDHDNYTWEESDGDGGEIDYLADLVVEGNVGIGTTVAGGKLEINSNAANIVKLTSTPGEDYTLINLDSAGDFIIDTYGSHPTVSPGQYVWKQAGTEVMRITAGNVGIGTTSPLYKLDVTGNIVNSNPSQGYIGLTGDLPGYTTSTYPTLKTNFTYMYFSVAGAYSAYMNSAGTLTAQSDRAKKENFTPVDLQEILNKIDQLPMTQWNFKGEDPSVKHIAPIAQDFHALFHLNGKDDKMISSIDPSGVALAGVKALSVKVKIQQRQIEKQQKQIEGLTEELAGLRKEKKEEK